MLLLATYGIFWAHFLWVRPTNFQGADDWLLLSLTSRGIVAAPHANRPFQYVWHLPAAALDASSLELSFLLHGHYLALSACLLLLLVLEVWPGHRRLAFLAGAICATWAPLDVLRLTTVYTVSHAGSTLGMLASVVLLLCSWTRRRPELLATALGVAFVTARGYEGVIPVLLAAPLLLLLRLDAGSRARLGAWVGTWWAAMAVVLVLAGLPLVQRGDATLYQREVLTNLDLSPIRFAQGMLGQFRHHLWPVIRPAQHVRVDGPSVFAAATCAVLVWLVGRRLGRDPQEGPATRFLQMTVGLAGAGLAYSAFVLASETTAHRAQFFSAPGIGLTFAAAICLVTGPLPGRWRSLVAALLAAWVVGVGTAHTTAIQAFWDQKGVYRTQRRILARILEQAPDLRPNTLVILLDETRSWPGSFGFRHAIEYLYEGRALGHLSGSSEIFYPVSFGRSGVRSEPWPIIREAWASPISHHRYAETVVFVARRSGEVRLLDEWPQGLLPPLPPGARYSPGERIAPLTGAPPRSRNTLLYQ